LAPGGIVVEPCPPSEIPVPKKMDDPTIEVPDAGAAPSEDCQRGKPVLASYARTENPVVEGTKTTPLL
jgi:hypothetical protein